MSKKSSLLKREIYLFLKNYLYFVSFRLRWSRTCHSRPENSMDCLYRIQEITVISFNEFNAHSGNMQIYMCVKLLSLVVCKITA